VRTLASRQGARVAVAQGKEGMDGGMVTTAVPGLHSCTTASTKTAMVETQP